jgi:hypothetical protein
VAANPAPGAEYFTAPRHPNQRRCEALRAYFTDGLTVEQAGARAGYTRASMASLLRDFRAGRLELFAPPGKPGPKTAPAKDRARARAGGRSGFHSQSGQWVRWRSTNHARTPAPRPG